MKNKDSLTKAYAINVLKDLMEKDMFVTEMVKEKGYSSPILINTLKYLTEINLVKSYTEKQSKVGNARLMYTLTSKGLEVAKKLREIENIMSGKEEEIPLEEEFGIIQNHYPVHINEYDNIVRVKDGNRIAEVYISNIHGKIKLKCALCDSEDCVHVNFAYSLPSVRELMEKYK